MFQYPCAYCKQPGHHIRYCKLLEDKNRTVAKSRMQPTKPQKTSNPSPDFSTKNKYAELYSSDEVEEGEIVEEFRKRPRIETTEDATNLNVVCNDKWSRSGINGVPIAQEQTSHSEPENEEEVSGPVSLHEIYSYMEKLRGRSWADIEYDSDSDYI